MSLDAAAAFLFACLAINLSPGPSVVYVTTIAASRGFLAGVFATLGLNVGIAIHVLAAALGVTAILATSAIAFTVVKYLGAAYLIYLGVVMLVSKQPSGSAAKAATGFSRGRSFREAVLVDLLNPKIALFFLAFLPQFVGQHDDGYFFQILMLGCIFLCTGTLVNVGYAFIAASSVNRLKDLRHRQIFSTLPGIIMIGLGLCLVVAER